VKSGYGLLIEALAPIQAADSPECPERARTVGITSSRLFQPEDRRLDLLRSDRDASAAFRSEEDSGCLYAAAGAQPPSLVEAREGGLIIVLVKLLNALPQFLETGPGVR